MYRTVVVVAKYNEDTEWTKEILHDVVIYNKGNGEIPNIGREAETYLRHIVETYDDDRYDFVVFLQGNPFDHINMDRDMFINKINTLYEVSNDKATPLNTLMHEKAYTFGTIAPEFCNRMFCLDSPQEYFDFPPGAQFIVPRSCIYHRPKKFYLDLFNAIHSLDVSAIGHSFVDPWTIERVWPLIFNTDIKHKT